MSKNGFSYYKAETDRFQDIKIKRLKKKYGCAGYAVYQYALNEIYRVEGCYIRFTEDQMFDCADYWDIPEIQVREMIDYCAEIGLFQSEAWKQKGILTARSIQSRYMDMCKVSKKKTYIPLDICLIEPEAVQVQPEPLPLFPDQYQSTQSDLPTNNFPELSGIFQNIPESSGNIPEKNDKEKQSKTNPPSIPPGTLEEEAKRLLISLALEEKKKPTMPESQPQRNTQGLLYQLQRYNLTPQEQEEVLRLSGHGQLGNPIWSILNDIATSTGIKTPRLFLMSRLRKAVAS